MKAIGNSIPRRDAIDKVTGEARFAADISVEGLLHMQLLFAGRPHARIKSLDTSSASKQPGVVAVLTAKDVPYNRYGLMIADQPVFCDEVVRFVGDRVAAVIAESPEQAAQARKHIKVTYEDLVVLDNPLDALEEDAPRLHAESPRNVAATAQVRRGDVASAFREADIIFENEYRTPMQEHAFLEPEAGIAFIDDQGRVTVRTAGQSVHDDQRQIAHALDLPPEQVRVIYGPIGGAFGGREDVSVQIVLALAAWSLQRPIKIVWSRKESILGHVKRHAMTLRHKWGARKDGKIIAAEVEILADAGAYRSTSSSVLENLHASAVGPYDIQNVSIKGKSVFTNNIPGGAFRGFGAPQSAFAAELQIARLAELLDVDPISLRLKNCLKAGSQLPTQSFPPGAAYLSEMIESCAHASGWVKEGGAWHAPRSLRSSRKRRGHGFAIAMKNSGFGYGFPEGSEARIILSGGAEIERAELHTAAADNGQGSHSALIQICAESLGIPIDRIDLISSDTATIGDSGPASASRLTAFAGSAVKLAASQALARWHDEDRPAVGETRWNAPATSPPDPETGACIDAIAISYGVQAVEVEVDTDTGIVRVIHVTAVHDPGKAVNPQQVIGQIHGGLIQALGWTLLENFVTEGGVVQTDGLSTYLIPSTLDIPQGIHCVLLENPDPVGPFGVRGIGEIPLIPLAPAIVAAIYDAIGVWFSHLPVLAEDVHARLNIRG